MTDTSIRVPLSDFRTTPEDQEAVQRTLASGWITAGPTTRRVEEQLAERIGVRHAIAVSSCTAALHLAYEAVGVEPGDEVIVPAITFVATAGAVHQCGGVPVAADVTSLQDLSIEADDVERRITPQTRAVVAMHYGGYPAAVNRLRALCDEAGLVLIEDSAHDPFRAPVGAVACMSFFTNKVLACGEGGLLATNDNAVAEHARTQRMHGVNLDTWTRHQAASLDYDVPRFGHNYRFDELRASLLESRLARVDEEIASRRRLVLRYRAALASVPSLSVPYEDADVAASACYTMPVVLDEHIDRTKLRNRLRERHGIQTSVLYPALHELGAWPDSDRGGRPIAEAVARRQLSLPLFGHMSDDQFDIVVNALADEL